MVCPDLKYLKLIPYPGKMLYLVFAFPTKCCGRGLAKSGGIYAIPDWVIPASAGHEGSSRISAYVKRTIKRVLATE